MYLHKGFEGKEIILFPEQQFTGILFHLHKAANASEKQKAILRFFFQKFPSQ